MVYTPYSYRHTQIIRLWSMLRKVVKEGKD